MFASQASFLRVEQLGTGALRGNEKLWPLSPAEADLGFAIFWASGCVGCFSSFS